MSTNIRNTRNTSVGELVAAAPTRARVFEQFGIDYCCGGKLPLEQACASAGAHIEEVLAALELAIRRRDQDAHRDWTTAGLTELVEHIVETHHTYLRQELPRLAGMMERVRSAHGERHPEVIECQQVFEALRAELGEHMVKEERMLFPVIEAMEKGQLQGSPPFGTVNNPIRMMEHEHDSAGNALARLRELTSGYRPPNDACNTFRALLSGLEDLEWDLHQHIHKENNILFPRAAELEGKLAQTIG